MGRQGRLLKSITKIQKIRSLSVYMSTLLLSILVQFVLVPVRAGSNYFLGDDLSVLVGFEKGDYASTPLQSIGNFSLDKWRPINTLVMHFLLKSFGNNPILFAIWSAFLMTVLALSITTMIRRMAWKSLKTRPAVAPIAVSALISSSPFAFMPRTSVFGFLEIGPIILVIWSLLLFDRFDLEDSRREILVYSSLLALAALLIHERFTVYSIAMAIVCFVRSWRNDNYRGAWMFFAGNIVFYFYTSFLVLGADPFRGGGEERLGDTLGPWMIQRFGVAVLGVLGGASGRNIGFDVTDPTRFINGLGLSSNLNLVPPITIMLTVAIGGLIATLRKDHLGQFSSCTIRFRRQFELLFIALILLVPSATVISRIETRWLFASLLLIAAAIGTVFNILQLQNKLIAGLLFLLVIMMNLANYDSFEDLEWWRNRATRVLEAVRNNAPEQGSWGVALVLDPEETMSRNNQVIVWALADGDALVRYIDNGPNQFLHGDVEVIDQCMNPCLIVKVWDDGEALPLLPEQIENQRIQVAWKTFPDG